MIVGMCIWMQTFWTSMNVLSNIYKIFSSYFSTKISFILMTQALMMNTPSKRNNAFAKAKVPTSVQKKTQFSSFVAFFGCNTNLNDSKPPMKQRTNASSHTGPWWSRNWGAAIFTVSSPSLWWSNRANNWALLWKFFFLSIPGEWWTISQLIGLGFGLPRIHCPLAGFITVRSFAHYHCFFSEPSGKAFFHILHEEGAASWPLKAMLKGLDGVLQKYIKFCPFKENCVLLSFWDMFVVI